MSPIRIDINWFWVSPELTLAVTGMLAFLVAAAQTAGARRPTPAPERLGVAEWLSVAGVGIAGLLALWVGMRGAEQSGAMVHLWGGMTHDPFSAWFKVAVSVAVLLVMAMNTSYRRPMFNRPELYPLLTLATMAIFLMASASELVLIFLAIEFLSITSYVLAGYLKDDPKSAEAGLKYFLFGTVCSAVMLYGMSLLYGMTGTTHLVDIAARLAAGPSALELQVTVIAACLVLAGIGFKISMAPFLQWVPEAYEGAPTPITAFLSVASKAAGFALAVRVFTVAFPSVELARHWGTLLGILAIITMTWGNTAAIWQVNVKRMLAYSTLAQIGFILTGIGWGTPLSLSAALIFTFNHSLIKSAMLML
ncbi:MAG: NADH-quinone oxidoreductase subunit N, partial [Armatimonadota bacterium]|nr:NADH-quinone oxidoreductase subunit N [Armatimonadota bacterium]